MWRLPLSMIGRGISGLRGQLLAFMNMVDSFPADEPRANAAMSKVEWHNREADRHALENKGESTTGREDDIWCKQSSQSRPRISLERQDLF